MTAIAFFVGFNVGAVMMALMAAAGRADRAIQGGGDDV